MSHLMAEEVSETPSAVRDSERNRFEGCQIRGRIRDNQIAGTESKIVKSSWTLGGLLSIPTKKRTDIEIRCPFEDSDPSHSRHHGRVKTRVLLPMLTQPSPILRCVAEVSLGSK